MSDILGPANAANAVTTRPGETRVFAALDSWFRDCSSPTADDGTDIEAAFLNGALAALRALWRANGNKLDGTTPIVPETGTDDFGLVSAMRQMIQRGQPLRGLDTGSANAMVVALSPTCIEYKDGMTLRIRKANAVNTGAVTLTIDGIGTRPVTRLDGTALKAGDLPANSNIEVIYDASLNAFAVANYAGIPAPVAFSDNVISQFQCVSFNFSVPSATYTVVPFASASLSSSGDVSLVSGACKINTPGRYLVCSNGQIGSTSGTSPAFGLAAASIYKNGSQVIQGQGVQTTTSGPTYFKETHGSATGVLDLVAGDLLNSTVYQVSGGTYSWDIANSMQIMRVK